jgi:predicted HAD superfamily phosphohydrolase YqeG
MKKIELDVDFIGGATKPTKQEFNAISEYIKNTKLKKKVLVSKSKIIIKKVSKQLA